MLQRGGFATQLGCCIDALWYLDCAESVYSIESMSKKLFEGLTL